MLSCLRRNMPGAFIAWAVEPGPAALLAQHPHLDELIVVPKGWLGKPAVVWELRRRLRSLRFDVAIDPQSLTKSSALAWLSGARTRIGFTAPRSRELARWLNNRRVPVQRPHVVDHQLDLLGAFGLADRAVEFHLPEDPSAAQRIQVLLDNAFPDRRFATVNPGAGWQSRMWPAERFGEVAQYLGHRHGLRALVVWSGDGERALAEQVVASSHGHAHLAPPTSLQELAAVLRRAKLLVASDTGPTHLAAAVGTFCVTLFGTTRPEVSGPYGSGHVRVCSPGPTTDSRHRRRASNDAMRQIESTAVCAACDQVLQRLSQAA
jgi:ADP-heptose:LPS heptosyltransferase